MEYDWGVKVEGKKVLLSGKASGKYESMVDGSVEIKVSLGIVELLRLAAKQTDNKIDDAMVEMVAGALK